MKTLKKISKFILICFAIFALGHVVFYVYCLFTPKMDINKTQSYYLYDNKECFKLSKFEIAKFEKDSKYITEQTPIITSNNSIGH